LTKGTGAGWSGGGWRLSDNQLYAVSKSSRENSGLEECRGRCDASCPLRREYTLMTNPIDQLGDIDEALDLVHEAASRSIPTLSGSSR
jgi:hypothetical protein